MYCPIHIPAVWTLCRIVYMHSPCDSTAINIVCAQMRTTLCSDSFTILGLWVLGLAVSKINESQLQTYESQTLFLMTSLQYYCIPGLAGTRWNKNLCAKDAGCAGNKITVYVTKFEFILLGKPLRKARYQYFSVVY